MTKFRTQYQIDCHTINQGIATNLVKMDYHVVEKEDE